MAHSAPTCLLTPLVRHLQVWEPLHILESWSHGVLDQALVHCMLSKHCSGSFLIFVTAPTEAHQRVKDIMVCYLEDLAFQPHNNLCLYRIWRESGLWELLDSARSDPEIQSLVVEIFARLDESDESRGQGEANNQTSKHIKHPDSATPPTSRLLHQDIEVSRWSLSVITASAHRRARSG